jgi:hypothetical protein
MVWRNSSDAEMVLLRCTVTVKMGSYVYRSEASQIGQPLHPYDIETYVDVRAEV